MELTTTIVLGCMVLGLSLLYMALRPKPEGGEVRKQKIQISQLQESTVVEERCIEDSPQPERYLSNSPNDAEQESLDAVISRLANTDPQQAELMRQFRQFVDAVAEQYKLPPLPLAVTQALRL